MPDCTGGIDVDSLPPSNERQVYTHEEYINLVLRSGHVMTHDYTNQSVDEDPRMIAFFDSLVQRELEGDSSDEEMSSSEEEMYTRVVTMSRYQRDMPETSSSDEAEDLPRQESGDGESSNDGIDDPAVSPFTIAFASVMAAQASERSEVAAASRSSSAEQSRVSHNTQDAGQESNRENNSESNTVQNPLLHSDFWTTRRSISELISQKRTAESKRQKLLKRKRKHETSSESSDDEVSIRKNISEKLKSENDDNLGHPSNIKSAQKQRSQLQLRKLKLMRESVMNSDSDKSLPDFESTDDKSRTHKSSEIQKDGDASHSRSKDCPEFGSLLNEKKSIPQEGACLIPNSSESQNSLDAWDLKVENSTHKKGSNCGDEQVAGSSNSDQQNKEADKKPHWSEFKRFKNKSSKSKRQYRSHSQEED